MVSSAVRARVLESFTELIFKGRKRVFCLLDEVNEEPARDVIICPSEAAKADGNGCVDATSSRTIIFMRAVEGDRLRV